MGSDNIGGEWKCENMGLDRKVEFCLFLVSK